MANPQKENGSTDIANELLEKIISSGFTATQLEIIFCVIRYTYGFHRKQHKMSITFISNCINKSTRFVKKELSELIKNNVLVEVEKPSFHTTRTIEINKNYDNWRGTTVPLVNYNSPGELEVHFEGNYSSPKKLKKETKNSYGDFSNVLLSDDEIAKLKAKFDNWQEKVNNLSCYIESTGKKYKSHYATILSWAKKNGEKENGKVVEYRDGYKYVNGKRML